MKTSVMLTSVLASASLLASPKVSNVTMTQDPYTRVVTVTYNLADEDAIITLDITTNGVSIGAENIYCCDGDVNRKVTAGADKKQLTWNPNKSWSGHKITDKSVRAVVKAWSLDVPPDYMVVDLTGTVSPRFYTCEAALPGGLLSNDYYRTTAMVMRRIPAEGVTWTMGNTKNEIGAYNDGREWPHTVTMDHDYYIGVFEMTQGQYYHAVGAKHYKNASDMTQDQFDEVDWMRRPLDCVRYVEIRNTVTPYKYQSGFTAYDYPATPKEDSIVGCHYKKTGIAFDLPGEAEWEFACRAGTPEGYWNNGKMILSSSSADDNLPARYSFGKGNPVEGDENYGVEDRHKWTPANGTAVVGMSSAPNAWGLYDMHGNVWEWCNDFWLQDLSTIKDYITHGETNANGANYLNGTKASDRYRVRRGGAWSWTPQYCRSGHRNYEGQYSKENIGLRLVCPVRIP